MAPTFCCSWDRAADREEWVSVIALRRSDVVDAMADSNAEIVTESSLILVFSLWLYQVLNMVTPTKVAHAIIITHQNGLIFLIVVV